MKMTSTGDNIIQRLVKHRIKPKREKSITWKVSMGGRRRLQYCKSSFQVKDETHVMGDCEDCEGDQEKD